jgi:hypothetical protein
MLPCFVRITAVQVLHFSMVSGFRKIACDAGRRRSLPTDFSSYKLRARCNLHAQCIATADSCWPRLAKSPIVAYSCPWRSFDPIQAATIALTAQNGLCLQPAAMILRTAGVYAELRGLGPSSTPRQRVEPRVLLQERFFPVSLRCANWARLAINT